jgi:hypothetical protein
MATLEMLDEDSDTKEKKEEANLGLVVTISYDVGPNLDSDEDDEVMSEQICNEYTPSVKKLMRLYLNKSRSLKGLLKQFDLL